MKRWRRQAYAVGMYIRQMRSGWKEVSQLASVGAGVRYTTLDAGERSELVFFFFVFTN